MQPSNQHPRLNDDLEELSWEDGQLFVVTPAHQGPKNHKPMQSLFIADQFPLDTARQMAEIKDLPSQDVCTNNADERLADFPALVPMVGNEMLGWLDDPLDHEAALAMQRNMRALPVISCHTLQSTVRADFAPSYGQEAGFREDLETVARLSGPLTPNKRLKLSAEIDMPPIVLADPTLTRGLVQMGAYQLENFHGIATPSLHPAQEASFSPSIGVAFEGSTIEPIQRPPGRLQSLNPQAAGTLSSASDMESALLESSEHTQMAASCGSGSGPDKGQMSGQPCGMRKDVVADADSESEASYDDAMALKKPGQALSGSMRRTRAAETHNESERKRRGRINEKLKALQELIPNANKTDKASVLSEAIDYLKKLRLQLQIMCCRSGMNISPFLISQGVHHLQMPTVGTGSTYGAEAGPGFGASAAAPTSFLGLPVISSVGSSAQICCPESSAPRHATQSLPVISSGSPQCSLSTTGLPLAVGATNGTQPASLHPPFPV